LPPSRPWAGGGGQAVFDPLGFESWDESYSILKSPEPSIVVGYSGNKVLLADKPQPRSIVLPAVKLLAWNAKFWIRKRTMFYAISRDHKAFEPELEALSELLHEGKIDASIKRGFDLEDVPVAHRDWLKLTGMGLIVVKAS